MLLGENDAGEMMGILAWEDLHDVSTAADLAVQYSQGQCAAMWNRVCGHFGPSTRPLEDPQAPPLGSQRRTTPVRGEHLQSCRELAGHSFHLAPELILGVL